MKPISQKQFVKIETIIMVFMLLDIELGLYTRKQCKRNNRPPKIIGMSVHSLILWFQDGVHTVGFRAFGMESRVLNQKVICGVLNVPMGEGGLFF